MIRAVKFIRALAIIGFVSTTPFALMMVYLNIEVFTVIMIFYSLLICIGPIISLIIFITVKRCVKNTPVDFLRKSHKITLLIIAVPVLLLPFFLGLFIIYDIIRAAGSHTSLSELSGSALLFAGSQLLGVFSGLLPLYFLSRHLLKIQRQNTEIHKI